MRGLPPTGFGDRGNGCCTGAPVSMTCRLLHFEHLSRWTQSTTGRSASAASHRGDKEIFYFNQVWVNKAIGRAIAAWRVMGPAAG